MRNRDLLLVHVNCHVNGTTFQSGLRFQTGLSSLRVSCKRALNVLVQNIWLKQRTQKDEKLVFEKKL